ncbi:MAG: MMPL family transporter, partial [Gammaproteobacteria bacterium]|nr:MMPL family transporter [Gammaproteobacteria bacterium]
MFDTPESRLERLLAHLVAHVLRLAPVVLILALLLTAVCAVYVKNNLGINTDTEDLLSETLPWRADYLAYKQRFPQFADTIAVVVDADTADAAEDAAAAMQQALAADIDLFADVFALQETEFLRRNQLLFLDLAELEDLADRLAQAQPFLARLAGEPNLVGVFDTLTAALDEAAAGSRFPIAGMLREVDATLANFGRGGDRHLSWQRLISGADDLPGIRVLLVRPYLDYSRLLPGEPAVLAIREQARELGYNAPGAPRVRLTGSAALGYEELDSVTRGASRAGVLALIMVSICLILGLRSPSLIAATLVSLIMGLIMTAAFATWAIGELNLISVAFAVLYVGLAVDFSIHYVLRVRELRRTHEKAFALTHACIHVGGSLALCALTTAVGFYAFIPTSYRGVAELGLIGGTSMFIGLAMSLTVLPAMLSVLPLGAPAEKRSSGLSGWLVRLPVAHTRYVLSGTLLLAIAALALLPRAQFDPDPIHLQDPQTESVETFRDLLNEASRSPYSITVVADGPGAARRDAAAAAALPEVDSVTFVDDFIPADQDDKLALLED